MLTIIIRTLLVSALLYAELASARSVISEGAKVMPLPGESFKLDEQDAFVILPPDAKTEIPWVWYAGGQTDLKLDLLEYRRFAIADLWPGENFHPIWNLPGNAIAALAFPCNYSRSL